MNIEAAPKSPAIPEVFFYFKLILWLYRQPLYRILTFFFLQVAHYLEILLESELNLENRYERFRDKEDRFNRTLMHYAVEHGFLDVTKTLAKKCPLLLALQTTEQIEPKKIKCLLPVEVALLTEKDDVASYLIRMMWHPIWSGWCGMKGTHRNYLPAKSTKLEFH